VRAHGVVGVKDVSEADALLHDGEAAVDAGAHYLDCTGEPPFVREVFEVYGPRADSALIEEK